MINTNFDIVIAINNYYFHFITNTRLHYMKSNGTKSSKNKITMRRKKFKRIELC